MSVPVIVKDSSGKEVALPKIQVQEYLTVSEWLYERDKRRLLEDAEAAGLPPQERFAELRKLTDVRNSLGNVIRECYFADGAMRVIETCCARASVDHKTLSLSPDEMASVALQLCSYKLPDAPGGSAGDETRPPETSGKGG